MILDITEKEYRAIKCNSYSSLKDFSTDRRKYYRRYILEEEVKEKENKAANMGRLVDCLLMEPEEFDNYFFLSTCVKIPGGMLGDFIFQLAELVGKDIDGDFEAHAEEAYKLAGFKIAFKSVLKKLEDPENKLYYNECLKVTYLKMTMVTVQDVTNAEKIVEELMNNSNTSAVCALTSGTRYTVHNQLKISEYQVDGLDLKSMLDKLIVDHKDRQVFIYDLKCTWSVENFYKEYYLYRKSYIQAYLYYKAIENMVNDEKHELFGYAVLPPKFIVCDSINYYQPLIYTLDESDLDEAYNGFEYKGTKYPGVGEIITNLKWAILNDQWTISRKNFDNNGLVKLKE